MTYTLICYKPSSSDYCRGCHMASYSSDFELHCSDQAQEVVELWGKKLFDNQHMGINEDGYEMTLLIDGRDQSEISSRQWRCYDEEGGEAALESDRLQEQLDRMEELERRANERCGQLLDEERREEERKKLLAAELERERQRQAEEQQAKQELADYRRLKAKYEAGGVS